MTKLIGPIIVVALIVGGAWYLLRPTPEVLGTTSASTAGSGATSSGPQTVEISSLTVDLEGETVQIEGTITKECPSTGCWAVIGDESGEIRIDTQNGGFALPLKREGSHIRVVGTVEVKDNGDVELSASSAEL